MHLRRGRASPRQCGGRRPHLLAQSPDGPYAPEGEARSEHLAEPPGLRFARQAAAFLDLVEGRPVEYCTLEQAVHLERLLTRLDQSAQ